jgi:hypothetical protein
MPLWKTDKSRYNDTINYISAKVSADLAQHIGTAARQGNVSPGDLGGELSLGSRSDSKRDENYGANSEQRRALRALLLCQRVYFSSIWCQITISAQGGGTPARFSQDAWPAATPSWDESRQATIEHWKNRSEQQVLDAIRTFTITATTAGAAAAAADKPGEAKLALPLLTLTRADDPFPGHGTCYAAVMFWLFRAGIVSYRWMMRNYGNLDMFALKDLFGLGRTIWAADKPFGAQDRFPAVPRGHIVHLYIDEPSAWLGHWLISTGDGHAYGRNNDDEDGRVDRFYDLCSLKNQFLAYKGTTMGKSGKTVVQQGIADVIDPMQIPHRI